MRTFYTILAAMLAMPLLAQNLENAPDTLLFHPFEGLLDPADTMLTQPTGYDTHWVNYDQDNKIGLCVSSGSTPKGWYWESDLGFVNPNQSDNDAFTSCSFLQSGNPQNKNWLMTSPVYIPDDSYYLCWRSLSYYGPDFMDGYRVLVSTDSNLPASFTDTVFSAAQTVSRLVVGSLELEDYIFSEGYIHANGYTDTTYFFLDSEPNGVFYHGKMEPHSVSLAEYAGETIYISFLHDSYDDFQLQVDDILVANNYISTSSPSDVLYFNVLPNPVGQSAFVNWKTRSPQAGRLSILDVRGNLMFEKTFNSREEGQIFLDAQGFAPGVYYCRLETTNGQSTQLMLKL